MPPAITRLLGEATEHGRPARALIVLVVVTALGVGGYVAGRAMTEAPSGGPAGSGPTASYDGGRPQPTSGPPAPDHRSPGGRRAEARASAGGPSEASSPTATTPRATTPATRTPRAPRPSPARATGTPSSETATPSTSPSESSTTPSATTTDTTPPQTNLSETFPANAALFTFSASEPATYTCSLDAAEYTSCGSPLRYLGLAAGWHTLDVRATDAAGNTDPTPAESRWHTDLGVPDLGVPAD